MTAKVLYYLTHRNLIYQCKWGLLRHAVVTNFSPSLEDIKELDFPFLPLRAPRDFKNEVFVVVVVMLIIISA